MKESASFSGNDIESTSLNFSELRELGLKYIQELSGDVWTDYNSHDPGITILEQLCYAITDIAFRTSLPIEELLTPGKGLSVNTKNNAFFSPASIYSSHPVTLNDIRKLIINEFDEIQNVWIHTSVNSGYQEQLRGINRIEILPKINFINTIKLKAGKRELFLKEVNNFLHENRNIGESFENAILLEPQLIHIDFDLYVSEKVDLEKTLANVFQKLFEFIYTPVRFYSFDEMLEKEYSLGEIFSGPRLSKGFLQNHIPEKRLKTIQINEIQKLLSKIDGIKKCDVKGIECGGKKYSELVVDENKFFHLLEENDLANISDNKLEGIYSTMNVFINYKQLHLLDKQEINNLFVENWSKKNRTYTFGISKQDFFSKKLNGKYHKLTDYYSIQRHFPLIYGIGEEGLSKNDSVERHAKALQLKAYLMLFEQHMGNHLSQLGNLNEIFNIDFKNTTQKTYFSQRLSSVPDIDKLFTSEELPFESGLEPEHVFYDRKNRVYDHLLARFGETLSDIPWLIARRLNMIKSENELNRILIQKKSEFLLKLEDLSYYRHKGESFHQKEEKEFVRIPSGLEQIILAKTGIPDIGDRSLFPEISILNPHLTKSEEPFESNDKFNKKYRVLRADEINGADKIDNGAQLPNAMFGEIGLKILYRETLNFENYRLSINDSSAERVHVIFQKQPNKWVHLFTSSSEEEAVQNISQIIDFFVEKNIQSEGLFLVDHILLNDFINIKDSKYGFCFLDEYGNKLFRTDEEDSWSSSEEERNKRIAEFYNSAISMDSYFAEEGNWKLKNKEGIVLATLNSNRNNQKLFSDFDELFKQTKDLIKLFSKPEKENGRIRLQEVEKIRLKGSMVSRKMNYGQRRLVFQRKLSSGEIIDEDFFDLNITLLLPDWPARFQEERFKDYISDIFHERMPAHLSNKILWINANEMKSFEEKYHSWEKLKSEQKDYIEISENLKNAAFEVYRKLMELKRKR